MEAQSVKFRKILAIAVLFFNSCYCAENPHSLTFSTKECSLIEPVYDHKFDFVTLHSEMAHQAFGTKGDKFEYNICGNLTRSCDGRTASACLTRGDKQFVLGIEQQLNYDNGKMYFNFSSGDNCGTGKFLLHVIISCDYTLDPIQSQVTNYANDACSFYINFETPLACLPEPDAVKSNACSVKDPKNGHNYDLMSLSDFNYRTTDRNGSEFIINICKPVLYGEFTMCPAGSSVCFADLKSSDYKKKFYNYGTVHANPIIENGELLMQHTSMTQCNGAENYTSSIHFECDKRIKMGHVKYIGRFGCLHKFSFATPLACNDLAPCTAITRNSEIIDLSALMDKPYTLSFDDKKYTFAICGKAGTPCLENNGACFTQNGQATSLGSSNSNLRIDNEGSYLLYEGGATCQTTTANNPTTTTTTTKSTTTFWSTKIEFVCANNATKDNNGSSENGVAFGVPKIIENSNCTLLIKYQTALACLEQMKCKAKTYFQEREELVDLTPLISAHDNYEAKISDSLLSAHKVGAKTKFYLNVCRPLVPTLHLGCPGNSAACMAEVGESSTPEEEQSLGFPLSSIVAKNRTSALLRYDHGATCPTDKNSQLSAGIEFDCDPRAGRGTPLLRDISDCSYEFSWATNVICPIHKCSFDIDNCEIFNDELDVRFNLKDSTITQNGDINLKTAKHDLKVNFCGQPSKVETDYAQGLVNIFLKTTFVCDGDGRVNVQLLLICSNETNFTTSAISDCNLIYTQQTPDICKFLGLTVPLKQESTTELPKSNNKSESGHSVKRSFSLGAIFAALLTLACVVVFLAILTFSPGRRNALRRLFRRSTTAVRYSRVQSNEEANLLLESNGQFTDSDDDMLL